MSYLRTIAIFAVLIVITPFLGLPRDWKDILYVIFGLCIVLLCYKLNTLAHPKKPVEKPAQSVYVDSKNETV